MVINWWIVDSLFCLESYLCEITSYMQSMDIYFKLSAQILEK